MEHGSTLSSLLTLEQLETYKEKGYMIIDDPCPRDLVDAVLAEMDPLYHSDFGPDAGFNYISDRRQAGMTEV